MTTKKIIIKYSEDFRENKIAGEVYRIFRNNQINPINIITSYNPQKGVGDTIYFFKESDNLPNKSELEEMLKEIKIIEIRIEMNNLALKREVSKIK